MAKDMKMLDKNRMTPDRALALTFVFLAGIVGAHFLKYLTV